MQCEQLFGQMAGRPGMAVTGSALHGACQLRPLQCALQESCPALTAEAMWTQPLSTPTATTPLQPCSHSPDPQSHIQAAEPAAGEGVQQMLLLLTEQVSHLASRVDGLTQAFPQTAPAAEEGPARQTQMHLKKVVQQELRPLLEQMLHSLTTQMPPARATLLAPAVSKAAQQALTPHFKGMAAQQQQQLADARLLLEDFAEQQSAQQQQLVQQLVHRNATSSASDAALSRQLSSSDHASPSGSSGGGCSALFHCRS